MIPRTWAPNSPARLLCSPLAFQLLFSRVLPTVRWTNSGNVMTPIRANFMPMPMPAAGRSINYRARSSIAQLAAVGILPPIGAPLTLLLPGQFPQGVPPMLMPTPQFQPRSRRAPSISAGGPPKAVLGGPGAKGRVITETAPTLTGTAPSQKTKKVVVNIPRETIPVEGDGETLGDGVAPRREIWARIPLRPSEVLGRETGASRHR